MKYRIPSIVTLLLLASESHAQNCKPMLQYNPNAELKINGISYYNNSPGNPTQIPTITLPLGFSSFTGTITAIQNANCTPVIPASPGGIPCPISKTHIRIQNPNISPASGSYITGTSNILSYTSGLQEGMNTIIVYADCQSSSYSGQVTQMAAFNINIIKTVSVPFISTISSECHYTVSGGQHTSTYSGKKIFKIAIVTLPPSGTTVSILRKGNNNIYTTLQTIAVLAQHAGSTIQFDNSGLGYNYGTYQVKFMNNGTELFPAGSSASYTHSFSFKNNACIIKTTLGPAQRRI